MTKSKRTPEFASSSKGVTHPYIEPTPPYVLAYVPQRWTVLGGKLVPQLATVPLVAGVNQIEYDKDGRVKFAQARSRLEEEGRTLIPYEWGPDGESYIQCVETKPGGSTTIADAWISAFQTAHVGSSTCETDIDAYVAWLESLVTSGKLPPCLPHRISEMLTAAKERHAEAQAQAAKDGGRSALRADELGAVVAVLEAAFKKARPAKAQTQKAKTPDLGGE